MSVYTPSLEDAAIDLRRYVKAVNEVGGFSKQNADRFLSNAKKIIEISQYKFGSNRLSAAIRILKKSDTEMSITKKCELLLMASYFLLTYKIST